MKSHAAAQRIVEQTLQFLPGELCDAAGQIPVCFEDFPSEALVADGLDPEILGLFVGAPRHESGHEPGPPPQIILYLENILMEGKEAGTSFDEEVRRTYLHELGHYLGLDEEDLADRDLD